MARKPRFTLPGFPQHVTQRGNNRQACFFGEDDYRFYLVKLADAAENYECEVHAYVLMSNHVHLLVTPAPAQGHLGNDASAGAQLCTLRQPAASANRHLVGGPVPVSLWGQRPLSLTPKLGLRLTHRDASSFPCVSALKIARFSRATNYSTRSAGKLVEVNGCPLSLHSGPSIASSTPWPGAKSKSSGRLTTNCLASWVINCVINNVTELLLAIMFSPVADYR